MAILRWPELLELAPVSRLRPRKIKLRVSAIRSLNSHPNRLFHGVGMGPTKSQFCQISYFGTLKIVARIGSKKNIFETIFQNFAATAPNLLKSTWITRILNPQIFSTFRWSPTGGHFSEFLRIFCGYMTGKITKIWQKFILRIWVQTW